MIEDKVVKEVAMMIFQGWLDEESTTVVADKIVTRLREKFNENPPELPIGYDPRIADLVTHGDW